MMTITLEPIPTAPGKARQAATDWLRANGATPEQLDSAVLIVSELVTNAVVHAGTPVTLRLDRDGSRLRVDVTDRAATDGLFGSRPSPNGGHGLHIVDRLSESWGFEITRAGKRVWACVPEVRMSDMPWPQAGASGNDAMAQVADPALSSLPATALVDELLTRVHAVLRVDTVAVLLIDRSGSSLVASASHGLEEEVRQGVRVPIGRGFAGRIAQTGLPETLDLVEPGLVANPLLWQAGIRSMLGVPMQVGGVLVGVMHVGSRSPRQFDDHDTAVLQLAADRIAIALRAEQNQSERIAARTLQQSLMPTRLPQIDGLQLASRFVPAEAFGVGGDWFDAFLLPSGALGLVVGDVAGSGLTAAVVMGRLRSALRAYALESSSPGEALDRLDHKFAHFEPDEMATVLYLVIERDLSSFTLSSAGHLPPVVAEPGRDTVLLRCDPAPPIGSHISAPHVDVHHELRDGMTVGCYTDGLIERRTEPLTLGLERLRQSFVAGDAESVCASVMNDLVGTTQIEDDTALLVCRRDI
jgi:serine phosphatase RsbU (regulator of sigma subunit)/anti-sigma regulatory factor (Ser/Thr protein kinase)